MSVKIIGEIGINHNGDLELCKKLIDSAVLAGCDYVKFQKRNPDVCVPEEQKSKPKSTPWGDMTYLEYKYKVEFGKEEYDEIDRYCKEKVLVGSHLYGIKIQLILYNYGSITKYHRLIINKELVEYAREKFDYLIISTGMSN